MLSKCANPDCNTPFQYLRDGRLYQIETPHPADGETGPGLAPEGKKPHKVEFFWLCAQCALRMTLTFQRGKGVIAVPLSGSMTRHAAAS